MAEVLNFDEVYAGDTSEDGKRIIVVLKRGGEDVHVTLPANEVLRLVLAAIAAQKLSNEKLATPLAPSSSLSFEKCTLQVDSTGTLARLLFQLPGGIDLPLEAKLPVLRSFLHAASEALGEEPAPPGSGSRH